MDGLLRPAIGDFPPGARIGGYRIEELTGRGGMAVVYRAMDERLDRVVALKVLAAELARDEAFRQRFIRESRAGAAVDHPHVIPVFEAGEAQGVLFIAMRYVTGGDVRALVGREGRLPTSRAVSIVTQVASALDAAHAHGLVHRDVKPANMLLAAAGDGTTPDHVYLSDFGLSKQSVSSASLTGTGQFLGTIDYMAPEQVEGRPIDGRTDLYALACAAFEMLTGDPPFRRDQNLAVMWAQVSAPPPSARAARPELPAEADQVLARALAKSPADRQASCMEFATALRAACAIRPAARQAAAHPATQLAYGPGGAGGAVGQAGTAMTTPPAASPPPAAVPGQEATMTQSAPGGPPQPGQPWPGTSSPPGQPWPGTSSPPGQPWPGTSSPPGQPWPGTYPPAAPRRGGKAPLVLLGLAIVACLAGLALLVLELRGQGNASSSAPGGGAISGTATTSPPPSVTSSPTPSPAASATASPTGQPPGSPAAVVTAYFDAINARKYRTAYDLNVSVQSQQSFSSFKAGFAGTQHDTVQILSVSGDVVSIRLIAGQADGTAKYYSGTYTVSNGVIVGSAIQQTG